MWLRSPLALLLPALASARLFCGSDDAAHAELLKPPVGTDISNLTEVDTNGKTACGMDREGYVLCWGATDSGARFSWRLPSKGLAWHLGTVNVCVVLPNSGGINCYDTRGDRPWQPYLNAALFQNIALIATASHSADFCVLTDTGGPACLLERTGSFSPSTSCSGCTKVATNRHMACAIRGSPGDLFCWPHEAGGLLPNDLEAWVFDFDIFQGHLCVLTLAKSVRCWDADPLDNITAFVAVDNAAAPFSKVTVGRDMVCALSELGDVVCWGEQAVVDAMPHNCSGVTSMGAGGSGSVCILAETCEEGQRVSATTITSSTTSSSSTVTSSSTRTSTTSSSVTSTSTGTSSSSSSSTSTKTSSTSVTTSSTATSTSSSSSTTTSTSSSSSTTTRAGVGGASGPGGSHGRAPEPSPAAAPEYGSFASTSTGTSLTESTNDVTWTLARSHDATTMEGVHYSTTLAGGVSTTFHHPTTLVGGASTTTAGAYDTMALAGGSSTGASSTLVTSASGTATTTGTSRLSSSPASTSSDSARSTTFTLAGVSSSLRPTATASGVVSSTSSTSAGVSSAAWPILSSTSTFAGVSSAAWPPTTSETITVATGDPGTSYPDALAADLGAGASSTARPVGAEGGVSVTDSPSTAPSTSLAETTGAGTSLAGPVAATTLPSAELSPAASGAAADQLIAAEQELAGPLLLRLEQGASETNAPLPYGGEILVSRLGGSGLQRLAVAGVEVSVPLAALPAAGPLAAVVAVFGAGDPGVAGLGGSGAVARVAGALVLSVRQVQGGAQVRVADLTDPISFSLPAVFSAGVECAFWDEEAHVWSSRGVSTSVANIVGERIRCTTTHLSLFGAVVRGAVQTLDCAKVASLFTHEALYNVFTKPWYTCRGAMIFGCLLLFLVLAGIVASLFDYKRAQNYLWKDEVFIAPASNSLRRRGSFDSESTGISGVSRSASMESLKEDESAFASSIPLMACSTLCCGCSCCALAHKSSRSVVLEALDDILSSWLQCFSEVRSVLVDFCCSFNADTATLGSGLLVGRLRALSRSAATGMVLMASQRAAAATTGLSDDTVREVTSNKALEKWFMEEQVKELKMEYAMNRFTSSASSIASPYDPTSSTPPTPGRASTALASLGSGSSQRLIWQQLRKVVSDELLEQTRMQGRRPLLIKAICLLFTQQNPVARLFTINIFSSCKQRVLLLAVELLGSFAFCCLFFRSTGLVRGKQAGGCLGGDGGVGESIGRFFVLSVASLLTAGLPVVLLSSLKTKKFTRLASGEAQQRRMKAWRLQGIAYWILGILHLGLCTGYTLLFLANVSEEDQEVWSLAGLLTLGQDLLMMPFFTAIVVPILARLLLCVHVTLACISREEFIGQACSSLYRRVMMPVEQI